MGLMWQVNPKKRRGKRKLSRKQIAAGFGGGKRRRRSRRSRAHRSSMPTPVQQFVARRRKRRGGSVARVSRRRRSGGSRGGSFKNGAFALLKAGAVGGAGAVLVDIGMGQIRGFLPASMQTPTNTDGSANYGYFGVKALLAVALGTYGRKLPVIGKYADEMATGAMSVMAYQFLRPMVPSNLSLGSLAAYFNPAPTQRPMLAGQRTGAYVSGVTPAIAVRSAGTSGRGARASSVVSMIAKNGTRAA